MLHHLGRTLKMLHFLTLMLRRGAIIFIVGGKTFHMQYIYFSSINCIRFQTASNHVKVD